MKKSLTPILALICLSLASCLKDKEETVILHYTESEYLALQKHLTLPEIPEIYNAPGATNDRATLGRVLFYDKRLSANNTVSCASCHKQDKAFSDDVAFSEGFDGELTLRNSLALAAVRDFPSSYDRPVLPQRFFWDERAGSIVEQSEQTIQNPIEMGSNMKTLGDKLLQEDFYQVLFAKAFPKDVEHLPSDQKILLAIRDFTNSIVSNNSRFDQGIKTVFDPVFNFSNFTAEENRGKEIFMQNCASCHGGNMVQANITIANNGLDEVYEDNGIGELSGISQQNGIFKVPMLRNIALTAPYMHDGRFATLKQVVEHYNSGIENHQNLHTLLKDEAGNAKRMNLSEEDKSALVAFLQTLTDLSTISHERFSNPFK